MYNTAVKTSAALHVFFPQPIERAQIEAVIALTESPRTMRRSAYDTKLAQEHLRDLTGLGLTAIPTQVLADYALDIALIRRITAYDACYIAVPTGRARWHSWTSCL